MQASLSPKPSAIFLHCHWRGAGTWLWSQFRANPAVVAFYEPFNESLAGMTLRTMPEMRPASYDSRHPGGERPYFEEFAPFFNTHGRGVRGFRPEFAYNSFFLAPDAKWRHLEEYLRLLMAHAESQGKTPVFKFCRSLGRIEWLRDNFPEALHLTVLRDPWSQWVSSSRIFERHGNPYFIAAPISILNANHRQPYVALALEALKIDTLPGAQTRREATWAQALRGKHLPSLFRTFMAYWVSTTFAALEETQLPVDCDRLSASDEYRRTIEASVRDQAGVTVSLFGAKPLARDLILSESSLHEVEQVRSDAIAAWTQLEAMQDQSNELFAIGRRLLESCLMRSALRTA